MKFYEVYRQADFFVVYVNDPVYYELLGKHPLFHETAVHFKGNKLVGKEYRYILPKEYKQNLQNAKLFVKEVLKSGNADKETTSQKENL